MAAFQAALVVFAIAAGPQTAQTELLTIFRDEFIGITPGEGKFPKSFQMGSEETQESQPIREITLRQRFAIAKYEVPQNLWQAVMGANPSEWKGPRNSVERLSFADAAEFCRKATELMRAAKLIDANQAIRLPSEAEWEYCARAGTTTKYSFGDAAKELGAYGWYTGNAAGNDPPVGAKKPNPWGLYDVHGYLWEWCADAYQPDLKQTPADGSPLAGDNHSQRVARGGSWKDKAEQLTSAFRKGLHPATRDSAVGLRCVLAIAAAGQAASSADGKFQPTAQESIADKGAKFEMLWGEGEFTEGPALAPDGSIFFSDIGNAIYRYDPKTNETKLFRQPSGRSNGLIFNAQGDLIVCEGANTGGGRRISITKGIHGGKDGDTRTLSDNFGGKRFNSPNDLAIDGKGRVYFTDPRYVGSEPRELDFEAVFLVAPDGATKVATRDVQKPNGILVSRDGQRVFVADNYAQGNRHLDAFDIQADGTLANKKILFDFGSGRGIDGMSLDPEGKIYATAGAGEKAGIYVFSPEGKHLAFLPTPGDPTNCVVVEAGESRLLYVTSAVMQKAARTPLKYGLFRLKLKAKG
jgi:gluconolactonase